MSNILRPRVAEDPAGDGPPAVTGSPHRRRHVVLLGLITIGFATLYTVYAFVCHANLRTSLFDLGIFDQAIRSYAQLQPPHTPIIGIRSSRDPGALQLADHFTPILAVVAPLYWIHNGPETLLVVQGVLFALAIPPLWIFTRRALGVLPAYCVVVAFGVSWPIQDAVSFQFHEVSFAVPIMAWMLERFQAGRYRQAALVSLLLLTVKEDMGPVVGMFGVCLLTRRFWRWGAALAIGGPLTTVVTTQIVIPLAGGSPRRNWTYDKLGHTPFQVVEQIVRHPIGVGVYALTPDIKIDTLLWLLAPLAFLSLRSPLILLAAPLIGERFLSDYPGLWGSGFHYNAFVVVILFCAAVDGVRSMRVSPRIRPYLHPAWALGVLLIALATLPRWTMYQQMSQRDFWHPHTADIPAAHAALARIPDGALVAAQNQVGAQITARAKVILWSPPSSRTPVEAPWVLADTERRTFPFATVADQRRRVDELIGNGYRVIYARDGYVVLHRPQGGSPS
jgi:uncharacterized membrane protein